MKRFLVLLSFLFCGFAFADTETINWYVDGTSYATTTCQTGDDITPPVAPLKTGYIFREWLPYIPLEYIETTGYNKIDTGYIVKQTTRIKAKASFFRTSSNGDYLCATIIGTKIYYYSRKIYFNSMSVNLELGDIIEFDWNKNTLTYSINDNAPETVSLSLTLDDRSLYLFNQHGNNDSAPYTSLFRMYYIQIYDNDVLIHDYVPALDQNGTPCVYDKVTEQFFYGNYAAGPIIE